MNVYELSPASVNVVQVLAELSLYSQARDVILPLEVSVNTTFSGAFPFTGVPLNAATGAIGATVFSTTRMTFVAYILSPSVPEP